MNLKKFKELSKNKNERNIIVSLFLFILLIGGILLYRSYAAYQEDKTFNVLQGVIPDFSKPLNLGEYIIKKSNTDTSIEKIEHEATEQTPALTDYRYTGSNPNNYVYFGCEGDTCTDDHLYRIIGVIPTQSSENGTYENRVKLIKATNYEGATATNGSSYTPSGKGYLWDTNGTNKWESSSLKNTLNEEYYNTLGAYQSYISQAKWYLGAPSWTNYQTYTTDQFYTEERSNTQGKSGGVTSYIAPIGLMYPSDYGYSIDKISAGIWTEQSLYNNRRNYQNSAWLYQLEVKYREWTITPEAVYSDSNGVRVCGVAAGGDINTGTASYASDLFGVRPTFYLKSNVLFDYGSGSVENPYRIKLEA